MSFSDDDAEFDLLPLPDVDFASVDLSAYEVVPSQQVTRPPQPPAVKRELVAAADEEEWDFPIRVGQDGTYGLKVISPVKGGTTSSTEAAAAPPAPPPPAPPPIGSARQQQQVNDFSTASQSSQLPLSQAAASRRAAALAYAATAGTSFSSSAARGQSAPPLPSVAFARPVGGFSQRPTLPLGPPPFVPPQHVTRAGSLGPAAVRGLVPGQGPVRPGLRPGSRDSTPGPPARGLSPVPGTTERERSADLIALRRQNEELVRALKEKENAFFTANGEASMLRRRMEEAEKQSKEAIDNLKAQYEAVEAKRRKKEEERRIDEEARKTKAVLENHNAATYSIRRPTTTAMMTTAGYPASSHNWGTQSILRSRGPRPPSQQQQGQPAWSQRRGGGQACHVAMTPAPIGRSGANGRELILRSGGSGSGRSSKGSPKGKERESPRSGQLLRQEAQQASPLPLAVPRFPGFHNTFASGAAGAGGSARRRASSAGVKAGLGGLYKTASSSQRSPSKPPPEDQLGRDVKKRRTSADPRSDDSHPGEEEEESTPKANVERRNAQTTTSSPVPSSDEIERDGGGSEVPMDVDDSGDGLGPVEEVPPGEEEDDEEGDYWRMEEKEVLFAILFNHQIAPLSPPAPFGSVGQTQLSAPSPSTPSALAVKNPTIQAVLAPLNPSTAAGATARDRSEHARASARILSALGGADAGRGGGAGIDLVAEVLKGLQAMAKLSERLNLIPLLMETLLLIRSLVLHLPRAGHVLLRLPSFISLITAIKERHLPVAVALPKGAKKGTLTPTAASVNNGDLMDEVGRQIKVRVTGAMLGVVEVVIWQAEGQTDAEVLGTLIQMPKLVSSLLNADAQPPEIIAQTIRILKLVSFFESLFRPLLAFPDEVASVRTDATRIPLVDLLCRLLRNPPAGLSDPKSLSLSLDIIDIFRTLCYKHPDDAVLLLSQQRSLVPTLVICLEQASNAIWGVDPSLEEMRRSIPNLVPTLQLLSLLTSPDDPALAQTAKLADRLRSAPKIDFPAAFERFMVAFGRICYAEMPDLEALASWGADGEAESSETWRVWEGELERAGDIARDVFDQVVEGPEGDLVYGVFVLEPDEETESLASSAVVNGHEHHNHHPHPDDENGAPPQSSQPLGPLMPEEGELAEGDSSRRNGNGGGDNGSDTEDDEPDALPALPLSSRTGATTGPTSQIRKSGRIKARAVPRQEVVKPSLRRQVEVVELSDSE